MSLPGFDVEALSGILGSISIACWVCVLSPQIIENFKRHSAEGLSVVFVVEWLLGDFFNVLGGLIQGILPTMIILAVYCTLADVVLLAQVFYYRGFTLSDAPQLKESREHEVLDGTEQEDQDEDTPLLARADSPIRADPSQVAVPEDTRRHSTGAMSIIEQINSEGQHFSPTVPLHDPSRDPTDAAASKGSESKTSLLWSALFNIAAIAVVCLAGALGWWISTGARRKPYDRHDVGDYAYEEHNNTAELEVDGWGQFFGYLSAILFLGSRVPQVLLNYKRKSTEGVSLLFFLFACIGNVSYVLSVFAYEPPCARWNTSVDAGTGKPVGYAQGCHAREWSEQYSRYIVVNLSWLIGSAGTLLVDLVIFVQFWMYRGRSPDEGTIRLGTPTGATDQR